jgi:hypothetical protein
VSIALCCRRFGRSCASRALGIGNVAYAAVRCFLYGPPLGIGDVAYTAVRCFLYGPPLGIGDVAYTTVYGGSNASITTSF